jgi:hypothetical protein
MYAYRQQDFSVMHTLSPKQRLRAVDAKAKRHDYIIDRFPDLVGESLKNLWFTCLYQGQLALDEPDQKIRQKCFDYITDIIAKYPIQITGCSLKEKIWLYMAKVSFKGTCAIRRLLKIGY